MNAFISHNFNLGSMISAAQHAVYLLFCLLVNQDVLSSGWQTKVQLLDREIPLVRQQQ
jgi:hypothetical protein